jgi:DNA-binding transcriptional LysR family regulator
VAGLLRLTVPLAVVPILLERPIASFCQAFPEVEVEIAASKDLVDLAAEGFDAGIRLGQFIAADMAAVRLTPPFPLVVVGSPEYLRQRGKPEPIAANLVRAGKLAHVLKSFSPMAPSVFLYYPSRHQMMPKLRAFIDHVKSRSGATNKTRSHIDDKRTRGAKMR